MVAEPRTYVVHGASATALRRQLGTTAWVVLEELLAQSCGPVERCVAATSVRSFAGDLGVSKDTVGRALARLRDAGVVTAVQSRASTGTFAAGSYRIGVPACITFVEPPNPTAVKTRPRPRASRPATVQRSLFDVDLALPERSTRAMPVTPDSSSRICTLVRDVPAGVGGGRVRSC